MFDKVLFKSMKKKWVIRLRTKSSEMEHYDGIVLRYSKNIVILHETYGFEFDGLQIFPRKSLKGYRDGGNETVYNAIVRQNRQIKKLFSGKWLLQANSVREVIEAAYKKKHWPIVETIQCDNNFYIGPITRVMEKSFIIRNYSSSGDWDGEAEIVYDKINRIELFGCYQRHFNQYMKKKAGK